MDGQTWKNKAGKISFPKDKKRKTWKDCVRSTRLEITCGEAPYLVSRYDTTTAEPIKLSRRIGMLDRKLRVINENTIEYDEWFKWVCIAYKSTYGYEWQGDNLLIARINLLLTFCDYLKAKWNKTPTKKELKIIAHIISWNLWQMDGLTNKVPLGGPESEKNEDGTISQEKEYYCIIHKRNGGSTITVKFADLQS